jgi:hypothetical protein
MSNYRVNGGEMTLKPHEVEFVEKAAARIVAHYEAADADTRAHGIDWYVGEGRGLAERVAKETGITFAEAAAVVAICSPRTRWDLQVKNTSRMVEHFLRGGSAETAPAGALFTASRERARQLLATGDFSIVGGPKVGPFFRNICGDFTVVTVDVWALRVVLGREANEDTLNPWTKGRRHSLVQAAYHKAAELLGVNVAAVQAVTWVVIRDNKLAMAA